MTYQSMARLGTSLGLRHLASKAKDSKLARLQEFSALAAKKCVQGGMLDPHLLAGLIDGYTRAREFTAKELEVLPDTVLSAVYARAEETSNKKEKAELTTAAKTLERHLKATLR